MSSRLGDYISLRDIRVTQNGKYNLANISYKLYNMNKKKMRWNIEYSYIEKWLDTLDDEAVSMIFAASERLRKEGPNLGRPLVDTLSYANVKNMKELRPAFS